MGIQYEHERPFWKGFEEESISFLDKEEIKTRKAFENTVGDGIGIRKTLSKMRTF
ncbi:hypothetical protein KSU1_D0268 [Candidatus Jettenia caeni]|uniref:Uncharacterized protein n=1 Tax=Candidatus Jettenia caeni TaxID=247490 RepID=I3IPD2_9BACT|nr:hypothetical protein KSU1_D0268 [Candidatus Jettenia caeni]